MEMDALCSGNALGPSQVPSQEELLWPESCRCQASGKTCLIGTSVHIIASKASQAPDSGCGAGVQLAGTTPARFAGTVARGHVPPRGHGLCKVNHGQLPSGPTSASAS